MTEFNKNNPLKSNQDINNALKNHCLYKILNPNSICVFGANNDFFNTMGSMQMRNIKSAFKGKLFPIHPRLKKVQGITAYQSVLDLPEIPDLAFLIIPNRVVPKIMEECGQKGIKRLIITTGGFRETGEQGDGIKLSKKIDSIAKKYGMRFIGPNCIGLYNGYANLNTFWAYFPHLIGNISIASQSGTIASLTSWQTRYRGIKIGKSISVGNERNIDLVDVLEYFRDDPQTSVIGLYIEEIKRGKEFIKLSKEVTPKKPIVAMYSGGEGAAARSVSSHTGSIAGNNKIFEGMFKQTGIISTNLIVDFLQFLKTLSYAQANNVYPKGRRVGILTNSGGSAAIMSKSTEYYGLEVPEFSRTLQEKVSKYIPPHASGKNPIDVTFSKNQKDFFTTLPKLLVKSGEIDLLLFDGFFDLKEMIEIFKKSGSPVDEMMKLSTESYYTNLLKTLQRIAHKKSIPILYSGPQLFSHQAYRDFIERDLPIFELWDAPPKNAAMLVKYSEYRRNFSE